MIDRFNDLIKKKKKECKETKIIHNNGIREYLIIKWIRNIMSLKSFTSSFTLTGVGSDEGASIFINNNYVKLLKAIIKH